MAKFEVKIKERIGVFIIVFLVISICLTSFALTIPWGKVDAHTKFGPAPVDLKLDLYEHKVKYDINAEVGILGKNISISDDKMFLTGLGEFQGNMGVVFDSYKDVKYRIYPETWDCTGTVVYVKTHTDQIPWWAVNMPQKISISVVLNETGNHFSRLRIDEVKLIVWKGWDNETRDYTNHATVWKFSPKDDYLYKTGDSKTYTHEITINEKYDKIGIVGLVNVTIIDTMGGENTDSGEYYVGNSSMWTINIMMISQTQAVSIMLMVIAFPLTIVGMIFCVIAIFFVYKQKRIGILIILLAGILQMLAVVFYVNGINTLIGLIGFVEPWFSWTYGLFLSTASFILLFVAFVIMLKFRPKPEIVEMKILHKK